MGLEEFYEEGGWKNVLSMEPDSEDDEQESESESEYEVSGSESEEEDDDEDDYEDSDSDDSGSEGSLDRWAPPPTEGSPPCRPTLPTHPAQLQTISVN